MAGASTIWVNADMSEQISDFNGEYVLITINTMQRIPLGQTLESAIKKLKELGREDIAAQLK